MTKPSLEDAVIADIVVSLDNPIGYVRGVLGRMFECEKENGSAIVRIGTTGRGKSPHYRVEPELSFDSFNPEARDKHFAAFHGRSHKKLDWGYDELRGEHWSSKEMTLEEVQKLLGELRKFEKKPRVNR